MENNYEEALKVLKERRTDEDTLECGETFCNALDTAIKALSLVQKKPKGKWIKYGSPRCGEQHYQCTNCKDYLNFGLYGDYYTEQFVFCPLCGAEMRGKGDD